MKGTKDMKNGNFRKADQTDESGSEPICPPGQASNESNERGTMTSAIARNNLF
jgi:hypothetical protein